MAKPQDIAADAFIKALSDELKKIEHIKAPVWAGIVKTGAGKQRPPVEKDWWFTRASSILRKVYLKGPVGVNKLRVKYGNKANMGMAPERSYKASGNIIRKILQQLEKAELLKQDTVKGHKGRVVTTKGRSTLDKLASTLVKARPKPAPKPTAPKAAPKAKPEAKPVKKEPAPAKPEAKAKPAPEAKPAPPPESKSPDQPVNKEEKDGK
jgi:small subunit ribosomal protein S19e|tara:strand:- start:210 stop:836 length:627 start_codon:yes stop_codon:yes gene_type:complete